MEDDEGRRGEKRSMRDRLDFKARVDEVSSGFEGCWGR